MLPANYYAAMTAPTPPPPVGWYPDPSGAPRQRYFDGRDWTEHYAPLGRQLTGPPAPKQSSSNWKVLLAVGGVLLFLVAIGSTIGGGDDEKTSTASAPSSRSAAVPTTPAQPAAPSTPKAAPAGSAVRDGKFEFQVLDISRAKTVSDPTGNPYMTTTAQGEFIVITLSVRNSGDEPRSYFGTNQTFIDASGREYGASSQADFWMNSGTGDINPGNFIQVKVAFDVPPGTPTDGAVLELHDSMFSGGVEVHLGAPRAGGG